MIEVTRTVVKTLFSLVYLKRKTKGTPLKGFMQVVQIVVWIVGIIFIIGILIDKSPAKLFTGLGASLAVVSFVFKDAILNLVSGILLSSDKMMKVLNPQFAKEVERDEEMNTLKPEVGEIRQSLSNMEGMLTKMINNVKNSKHNEND
jgi:hypothetical protein